jgi:preprotein translocase subunit SecE
LNEYNKPTLEEDDKDKSLSLSGFSLPTWLPLGRWYSRSREFFGEVQVEFKKIAWPTRRQVLVETGVVLLVVTILTLLVLFFDWIFAFVANHWLV